MAEAENPEGSVNITAETLFEILRREKDREELQPLQKNFYEEVVRYLNEKKSSIQQGSIFSEQEKEVLQVQLQSIKQIIREIYNRREKKILDSALIMARTNSNIVETSNMLPEEKKLFEALAQELATSRREVLASVLEGKAPNNQEEKRKENPPEQTETPKMKMVRFLQEVPKFYGDDAEIYGPFAEDDIASLPESVANLLIEKERAEEIEDKG
ncbi:MAG: hypothetical protein QXW00_00850 [Candidatus Woesearchaeota archaeon]